MASIENSLKYEAEVEPGKVRLVTSGEFVRAAKAVPPCRTGCQPVLPNARAARSTMAVPPCRTGCQPVPSNARAARSTTLPFLCEFAETMQTARDHFFSRFGDTAVHTRNLPHWAADSALIFITYRLADSMPADKLRAWQDDRAEWIKLHPEPWGAAATREYYHAFPARLDEMLDAGYGSCVLAREDCSRIVAENLLHFNAERYNLHSFVVMPNHVHVLMEIEKKGDLPKIVHGWKSYTAKRINEVTDGVGCVWQKEYYDRLIRDAAHYANTVEYIRENARIAEAFIGRTGCQPVPSNARAARSTVSAASGRTGCQPVQEMDLKV